MVQADVPLEIDGPIRLGMVGGGQGSFIGAVHRIAARMDGHFDLVAGALASTPERAMASARVLGLSTDRTYGDYAEMARTEARRPDGIEAVTIATPNHLHAPIARAFLGQGIHVICDKPLTATLAEARRLARGVAKSGALFILTHNYTGYPMVRQARAMVQDGALGTVRVVQVEYAQDWLTAAVEATGHKQALWRTDPAQSGGGAVVDIGTHAFNLIEFVTGLGAEALAADLQTFVPGRRVDDNGHVLVRFAGGARGMMWFSQVAPGAVNGLRLRVFGDLGGLDWAQEAPDHLWFTPHGGPQQRISRGGPGAGPDASRVTRVPAGHPEGYLEAFATIYSEAARAIAARRASLAVPPDVLYPTIEDGVAGMAFVDACQRSSARNAAWVTLRPRG